MTGPGVGFHPGPVSLVETVGFREECVLPELPRWRFTYPSQVLGCIWVLFC